MIGGWEGSGGGSRGAVVVCGRPHVMAVRFCHGETKEI